MTAINYDLGDSLKSERQGRWKQATSLSLEIKCSKTKETAFDPAGKVLSYS